MEILNAGGTDIYVSKEHRFGTDAVELFGFVNAPPRPRGGKAVSVSPLKNKVVWDLCTGCGIIAVLAASVTEAGAGAREVYACDVAEDALALLHETVAKSGLNIKPVLADLKCLPFDFPQYRETADVVTVNPPYFRLGSGLSPHTDAAEIARHETLCDIKDVITAAEFLLKFGGRFAVCIVPDRLTDTLCAMREHGIEPKILVNLVNSDNPQAWLCLIEGKRGGKAGMNVFVKDTST